MKFDYLELLTIKKSTGVYAGTIEHSEFGLSYKKNNTGDKQEWK